MALALGLLPAPALASTPAPPSIAARKVMLVTMPGIKLYSKGPDDRRRVASTIKMLNALVVRDHAKLTDVVRVPAKAASIDNGGVGIYTGQRLTVEQLLNMMLIASANDAAEALAIHIGGTETRYVAMMNAKAKELGLAHTTAADPHGLGKHEYSSAEDLSILARKVMADPVLRTIVRKRSVVVPRKGGGHDHYASTNKLLGHYTGIEGVKTGFTNPAGFCFVGAAKRNGVELVGVVLGCDSLEARFSQMRTLLNWGFAHTHLRFLASQSATYALTPSGDAGQPKVIAHPSKTLRMALLDGSPKVTRKVVPISPLRLPVKAGQKVGVLQLRQGNVLIATIPLQAVVSVAAASAPATPTPSASPVATASPQAVAVQTGPGLVGDVMHAIDVLWH